MFWKTALIFAKNEKVNLLFTGHKYCFFSPCSISKIVTQLMWEGGKKPKHEMYLK